MTNQNSSTGVAKRCQFPFSDGRGCRMLCSPLHSSFCAFHARQQLQLLESQRLGHEISASLNGDFLTATDINHVLGKLFTAVAQSRIPLRLQIRPLKQSPGQRRAPLHTSRPHRFQFFARRPPGAV